MQQVVNHFDDRTWSENAWRALLERLVHDGLLSWKEVTSLALGHMNPSQVGTSLASSEGFKRKYGKGEVMPKVMEWFYKQNGKCLDCGTRLELQADHWRARERSTIRSTLISLKTWYYGVAAVTSSGMKGMFKRTDQLSCAGAQRLMSSFIDSMATPDEASRLEAHLQYCDPCGRQLQSFISVRSLLARAEQPGSSPRISFLKHA